jgi:phosphatidylglycerophosphate synthase
MSIPSLAEVRAGGQPVGLKERRNEEHWAGRLYMRDISPYFSWLFVRLGVSPNALTGWMIVSGVLAGVVFALAPTGWAGILTALVGALLVQTYLMLDCADGEVARFTGRTSVAGVYLDRIGHYLSEVAILVGLGFRAHGGLGDWLAGTPVTGTAVPAGGWVVAGFAAALGAALIKAETDNVVVARAKSGMTAEPSGGDGALVPRASGLALARRLAAGLRFHRIIGAIELSLFIVVAAVLDAYVLGGGLMATRVLMAAALLAAAVQTVLHLISVLASRRLQ